MGILVCKDFLSGAFRKLLSDIILTELLILLFRYLSRKWQSENTMVGLKTSSYNHYMFSD